jgi:hypothetical protein
MPRSTQPPRKTSFGNIAPPRTGVALLPSPEITKTLCELLSESIPMALAAAAVGIPINTLGDWIRQGQRSQDGDEPLVLFARLISMADARGRIALVKTTATQPSEARRLLERASPREFSPEVATRRGVEAAAAGMEGAPRSVVAMPEVALSMEDWAAKHKPA